MSSSLKLIKDALAVFQEVVDRQGGPEEKAMLSHLVSKLRKAEMEEETRIRRMADDPLAFLGEMLKVVQGGVVSEEVRRRELQIRQRELRGNIQILRSIILHLEGTITHCAISERGIVDTLEEIKNRLVTVKSKMIEWEGM